MIYLGSYIILAIICSIFFLLLLFLLLNRYHIVVLLNVLLLPIAFIEPSFSDILFIFLLLFSIKGEYLDFYKFNNQKWILFFLYGYIFINILSFFYVEEYYDGIKFLITTIYLIMYSIFIYLYSNKGKYISIVKAYIIGSTFSAILGIVGFLGVSPSVLMYDSYRVKSVFKDPNVFGSFLIPAILILIDSLKSKKIIHSHIIIYILIIINFLGVVLSFSRGAWVNLIVTITTYFILNIKKINYSKLLKASLLCIILLSLIWACILDNNFKSFVLKRSQIQSYDIDRFNAQKFGITLIFDKLTGYGSGQYETSVLNVMGKKYSAHSLYVRVFLENGILGFCFLIASIVYLFLKLFSVHIRGDEDNYLRSSVLISILSGIVVNSFAIDTLHWRHFWLYIGLSISISEQYK